jgi:hypothetical protein
LRDEFVKQLYPLCHTCAGAQCFLQVRRSGSGEPAILLEIDDFDSVRRLYYQTLEPGKISCDGRNQRGQASVLADSVPIRSAVAFPPEVGGAPRQPISPKAENLDHVGPR